MAAATPDPHSRTPDQLPSAQHRRGKENPCSGCVDGNAHHGENLVFVGACRWRALVAPCEAPLQPVFQKLDQTKGAHEWHFLDHTKELRNARHVCGEEKESRALLPDESGTRENPVKSAD